MQKRIQKIVIPGRFPSLNEFFSLVWTNHESNRSKYTPQEVLNFVKKKYENIVIQSAIVANVKPMVEKCSIVTIWYEPNGMRDEDNVIFGKKLIMDGLKQAGIIKDDRRKFVGNGWADNVFIDKKNPRIEVYLMEGFRVSIDVDRLNQNVANVPRGTI
jgi:Holliday junction resolvase RusA-like endonuclease